jgi:hypothetical protein
LWRLASAAGSVGARQRQEQLTDKLLGVVAEAHPTEIDLQLFTRLAVGHRHRRRMTPVAQLLRKEPVQRCGMAALRRDGPST